MHRGSKQSEFVDCVLIHIADSRTLYNFRYNVNKRTQELNYYGLVLLTQLKGLIILVDFLPFFTIETTFVTSCLLYNAVSSF